MDTSKLREYVEKHVEVCGLLPYDQILGMVQMIWDAYLHDKRIFTMGNGGHCNTASHMINDIAKHTVSSDDKRKVVVGNRRFRTICLNDSVSFVTGIANDMGYDQVFSEQLENLMEEGDVVIGISGSGNSRNVLVALKRARELRGHTIALSGFDGGKALKEAELCIVVPSSKMVMVEDFHLMISHMVADELKMLVQQRTSLKG